LCFFGKVYLFYSEKGTELKKKSQKWILISEKGKFLANLIVDLHRFAWNFGVLKTNTQSVVDLVAREQSKRWKKCPKHTIFKKLLKILAKTFLSVTFILFALYTLKF
jgi:hypothetical protein